MVLRTDRFGWRCRVIFVVEIGGVSWAWQRSWTLRILQIYCRHIAADCRRLRWKTADCGGRCHGVCPVTLGLNSLKNGIPKTTLSLLSGRMSKDILILYPLIFTLTSPVSICIIPSLYIIRSPKIVTNGYRFSLSLYGNPILLTAASNI